MYFLTGEGKSLEDESLTTDVLMNVLQLIDAITKIAETNQKHETYLFIFLLASSTYLMMKAYYQFLEWKLFLQFGGPHYALTH